MTREAWLQRLVELLHPLFTTADFTIPPIIHVSVGWPSTRARTLRPRIGECWAPTFSEDGAHHIFISPLLSDPLEVAAVMVHEMLHVAVGVEKGHGGTFKAAMKKVGLEGKPTATVAGPELVEALTVLLRPLPPYPHPPLKPAAHLRRAQTTRQRKVTCPNPAHPPYMVRMSRDTMRRGLPRCGACGMEMVSEDKPPIENPPPMSGGGWENTRNDNLVP